MSGSENGSSSTSMSLADQRIIPISLITIFDLVHCVGLAGQNPATFLPAPHLLERTIKTSIQSQGGAVESNYNRVTRHGIPIHDGGFAVEDLDGVVAFGSIKPILPNFTAATHVWVNEGNPGRDAKWKKKVELRNWQTIDPTRPGAVDIGSVVSALQTINDTALVDVRVWINPDKTTEWFRFNLILRCWDQVVNGRSRRSPLETMEVEGIPTIDIERYGYRFASQP